PEDESGVFTSASRPVAPPSSFVDDLSLGDDELAPPPRPAPPLRTPAIVRRTPAPGVPKSPTGPLPRIDESRSTPAGGHDVSMFAEQTRVGAFSYDDRAASQPPPLGPDRRGEAFGDAARAQRDARRSRHRRRRRRAEDDCAAAAGDAR